MRRNRAGMSVCILAATLLLAVRPAHCAVITLPAPHAAGQPAPRTNGLAVQIDTTAQVGLGYVPIKVTVDAAAPAQTARVLQVRFKTIGDPRNRPPLEILQTLEISAGSRSATAIVRFPHFYLFDLQFDLWDEEEHLPDLAYNVGGINVIPSAVSPCLCVDHDGSEHPLAFKGRAPFNGMLIRRGRAGAHYAPYDLPELMIDYSQWKCVLVPLDELAWIIDNRPAAWSAMRQWIVSGGALLVYGRTDFKGKLAELNQLLGLNRYEPVDRDAQGNLLEPQWQKILFNVDRIINSIAWSFAAPDRQALDELQRTSRTRLEATSIFMHPMALGTIVALDSVDPATEPEAYWDAIGYDDSGGIRWEPHYESSLYNGNPILWDFLIPGVGLAPIGAFEGLIAVFVIGVGPVNYLLLRRRQRTSLLLVTVPATAFLVTCGLLAYAMFIDGVGIRCRTRSFTEIDQRHGEAVCWSRIAYYAGRQPADGLEFSLDTEVYPVDSQFVPGYRSGSGLRTIDVGATTRRLAGNWLPIRTYAQLLTVRGRKADARLGITGRVADKNLQVTNHLGTAIQQLLVVDEEGSFAWAEAIANAASAPLDEIDSWSAHERLDKRHELEMLEGSGLSALRRSGLVQVRGPVAGSSLPIGLTLERGLRSACDTFQLPPRSYVAVVDCSPEFELGLPAAEVKASYHVILGHW